MGLLDRPLVKLRVGETVSGGGRPDISRLMVPGNFFGTLRTRWTNFTRSFWPNSTSPVQGSKIDYDKTRKLYRNDDPRTNLGSGVVRRIVNSRPDFIDLPFPSSGDEVVDEFLEKCIHVFWAAELRQMIRDATRDAETVVRIRRHSETNKLVSPEEWESCYLEIVPPETVTVYYRQNGDLREIERVYIRHEVDEIIEETRSNGSAITLPQVRRKVIIEEITTDEYRYFDQTEGLWRDDLQSVNSWGFVPIREVANEFDASIGGGQSDLEAPMPFIMAMHDVLAQTLVAHKAHSIPKAKFKINDMITFLGNNFPDSFEKDENGNIIPTTFNGTVNWKGTEILFFQGEEDGDFMQAESVLGDSVSLLDFLIGCISIASETPRSILMATPKDDKDEFVPFSKAINRKRAYFAKEIQEICKMVLAINLMVPDRIPMAWDDLTPEEALAKAQTLQQEVMAQEVLATREVISDRTVRAQLRPRIPRMKSSTQEAADAKGNKQIEVTSPQSVSGSDSGKNE